MWEWGGQEGRRAHAREREIDLNLVEIMLFFGGGCLQWAHFIEKNYLIKIFQYS